MTGAAAVFAAVFVALYTAHQVGDHWVQTSAQAAGKGRRGWPGRLACARHVAGLTVVKAAALGLAAAVVGLGLNPLAVAAGLGVDAAAHYWADRRFTLAALARRAGKAEFWHLGTPRPGHDDAPHLGTGAYALDQSFHLAFVFLAALIIAGGSHG